MGWQNITSLLPQQNHSTKSECGTHLRHILYVLGTGMPECIVAVFDLDILALTLHSVTFLNHERHGTRAQVGQSRCLQVASCELWLRRLPADGAAAADMRAHIDRASPLAWQQPVLLPYHTLGDRQLSLPRYFKELFTSALNCSLALHVGY